VAISFLQIVMNCDCGVYPSCQSEIVSLRSCNDNARTCLQRRLKMLFQQLKQKTPSEHVHL
jgi:hypothetical protein